ncbi:MAG: hypothetical protein KCHDKBKB_01556 [Elusimicrobia bacterium]|nr:hypothetical protein [Elusimicrobiota bacterium]
MEATPIKTPERRRHRRFQTEFDVDLVLFSGSRAGDQITGKVINISREGVGIILRSEVARGTQVALTIFSDEDQSVCSGEVIWSREINGEIIQGIRISQWSYLDPAIERQIQTTKLPL